MRAMKLSAGSCVVGCNVQTVIDSQRKLIVEFDITQDGNERNQLARLAGQRRPRWGTRL